MKIALFMVLLAGVSSGCQPAQDPNTKKEASMQTQPAAVPVENTGGALEIATLGAGCFWCVEAIYQDLKGVAKVESGYAGGHVDNPSYNEVCSGLTGHAEVIQVRFDPAVVSYREILEIFFNVHDPTTLNRQGNDVGTQYRSVVYYHSPEQKQVAEEMKQTAAQWWDDPVVTEIAPFDRFYVAEKYHQNYYKDNPNQPYCAFVIAPKYKKFKEKYKEKLKQ